MIWLIDSNIIIALSDLEHVHHHRVVEWFGRQARFATCPIVEGSLVRYLVRSGAALCAVQTALHLLMDNPGHEFWPDSVSYADADLTRVIGHHQVTDAYLVSLARHHGPDARLATLDEGLAGLYPDVVTLVGADKD